MAWRFVLPSLKLSGGVLEALRLAERLSQEESRAGLIALWRSPHPVTSTLEVEWLSQWTTRVQAAPVQIFILLARFWRLVRVHGPSKYVFTHYATLPLSIAVPRGQRFFFVQGLEWTFVGRGIGWLLRAIILAFYRRGTVISANPYLTASLRRHGVHVRYEAPIWANSAFAVESSRPRDIDFVMVLRKGALKRLDLYRSFLQMANAAGDLNVAAISTEDEILASIKEQVMLTALRPSLSEMRDIYARSKCFIHLSDHEGFGLPPLEAMGAGCVPICRHSGGVSVYMHGRLSDLLYPPDTPIDDIFARAVELVRSPHELESYREVARKIFVDGLAAGNDQKQAMRLLDS